MSGDLSGKLLELDDFLLSEAAGEDAMLLAELDGFLAGVIVCPDMIMPSEWLPAVWGKRRRCSRTRTKRNPSSI